MQTMREFSPVLGDKPIKDLASWSLTKGWTDHDC